MIARSLANQPWVGPIIFVGSGSAFQIRNNTNDTADNKALQINAGGSFANSRGGGINCYGNEYATYGGSVSLYGGAVTSGHIEGLLANASAVFRIRTSGSVDLFRVLYNGNIACGGAGSYGGGVKVVFLSDATTVPTTNPTGGGILYAEAGALKYRGSGGTVSTLGAA